MVGTFEQTHFVLSQCAHWALWEFFESLLWVLYKEPSGHIVKELKGFFHKIPSGCIMDTLWKNKVSLFKKCPPLTCWVWARQIGGHFLKITNMCLLGLGWENRWVFFESVHYLPTGYEPGKLFQNPQLTHNVPIGYIALHPQCQWLNVSLGTQQEMVLK